MKIQTEFKSLTNSINYKINEFERKMSQKNGFCCHSCPTLIHEIESDLKTLVNKKKDLRGERAILLKKGCTATQRRWKSISTKKEVKKIPPRCIQNALSSPGRIFRIMCEFSGNLAVLGTAAYFFPSFRVGCLAWIPDISITLPLNFLLNKLIPPKSSSYEESNYGRKILASPFLVGVQNPIMEEVFFRHNLQPWIGRIPTSVLFGLAHVFNDHDEAMKQACIAGVGGYFYGYLAENYGIQAPIGAHMLNNSVLLFLARLFSQKD